MENTYVIYRLGYDYGVGVKTSTGDRMQLGVVGNIETVGGGGRGGSGGLQYVRIERTSDLEKALGISADVSGSVGLFSASDRFNFASNSKVQENSITLLIHARVMLGFQQIRQPLLAEAAAPLVQEGQNDLFAQRYGDCFLVGMESGGEFFGLLQIDTKSETDKETVSNALSGGYGPFDANIAVGLSTALTTTNSDARVNVFYEGGTLEKFPTNPAELLDAANAWLNSVPQNAKPYSALLMPYIIANGPLPPNAEDLNHQKEVLASCAKLRAQSQDKRNLLEYMMDPRHHDEFVWDGQTVDLGKLLAAVELDLQTIHEAASFAIDHAKESMEVEAFAREKKALPNYSLTVLPTMPPRVAHRPGNDLEPLIGDWNNAAENQPVSNITFVKADDAKSVSVIATFEGHMVRAKGAWDQDTKTLNGELRYGDGSVLHPGPQRVWAYSLSVGGDGLLHAIGQVAVLTQTQELMPTGSWPPAPTDTSVFRRV